MFNKTKFLIRKRALGDVLWIEPLIRQLAPGYKKLIVLTKFNDLFINYPLSNVQFINDFSIFHKVSLLIQRTFKFKGRYIDLDDAYEKLPAMHILHAYQTKAGLPLTTEYPRLYSTTPRQVIAGNGKYAVIHIESFSVRNYRKVYGIDWEKVVAHLKDSGFEVIQIGVQPEMIDGATHVKTTIPEMINVIQYCGLFIGIDSGPSHIAAAFKKSSLLFFGAVNPWYRHFAGLFTGIIMQSPCEFQPCYHTGGSMYGPECRLVGEEGIPKCSIHTTEKVIFNIGKLINNDKTPF